MTVLIAINGSEDSDTACEVLERPNRGGEDRAVVITVVPHHLFVRGRIDRGLEASGDDDTVEGVVDAERVVQGCAARVKTLFRSVESRIYSGEPEVEILDAALEIDVELIVVASRQRSVVAEWLVGSISHAVLQKSRYSVLVARPGAVPFENGSCIRRLAGVG